VCLFLVVVGLVFTLNGIVQRFKFRDAEARWQRSPFLLDQRGDLRGPPAWVVEQRVWLAFARLSLRVGPGLVALGLVGLIVLEVTK
jgi:hypothetical protein